MKIKTKYEPHQKVWLFEDNRPIEKEIKGISITVGTIRSTSGGIRIRYYFKEFENDFLEKDIFTTKEELINSL